MALKIKVDDVVCEIDKFTLGESWLLEREYGVTNLENGQDAHWGIGGMLGMVAIAIKRSEPDLTEAQAKKRVEALTDEQIEIIEDKPKRPTKAASASAPDTSTPPARPKAGE